MLFVQNFRTRFPEYSDVADSRIQFFIADAVLIMEDPSRWLDFYEVAQAYLVAHMLARASGSESGDFNSLAPVKRQEVDDVSVEYAVAALDPKAEDLYSTTYGKSYIMYRRMCFTGIYGV